WPKTKEVPALLAAAIASTASLIAANTRVAPGTLSRMTAVANVTSSATAACPHATPRRSSLTIQARASRAKTPNADWRFSIAPLRQARLDSAGERTPTCGVILRKRGSPILLQGGEKCATQQRRSTEA